MTSYSEDSEIEALLARHCDGVATETEHTRLQSLLRDERRHRERAVELLELEALLIWHHGGGADAEAPGVQRVEARGRPSRRAVSALALVAAAACAVALWGPSWRSKRHGDEGATGAIGLALQWELDPTAGTVYALESSDVVRLERGELFVRSLGIAAQPLTIHTPAAFATARGTSFYIGIQPRTEEEKDPMIRDLTRVLVLGGTVTLSNSLGSVDAAEGTLAVASDDGAPALVVAEGVNTFACDLYGRIAANRGPAASFCYSPYSIATALTMLAEGAAGETADELAAALHVPRAARRSEGIDARLPFEWSRLHTGHAELRAMFDAAARIERANELRARVAAIGKERDELERRIEATEDRAERRELRREDDRLAAEAKALHEGVPTYELDVANALWVERTFPLEPSYVSALDGSYGTGAAQMADFRNQPEGELNRINRWIADHTRGRIPRLLTPDDISHQTALVLANALVFAGDWRTPFEVQETEPAPFTSSDGKTRTVQLMQGTIQRLRYSAYEGNGLLFDTPRTVRGDDERTYPGEDGFQLVELPYRGGDLAMLVVLPRANDGLAALEARLDAQALATWRASLQERTVRVALPRFSSSTRIELREVLEALGVRRAFQSPAASDGAQFPRITSSDEAAAQLYVERVIHGVELTVNEAGTEASAATVVTSKWGASARPFVPEFRADHGFLYTIVHVPTGLVLFAGRYDGDS